jgi:hypothetical protein
LKEEMDVLMLHVLVADDGFWHHVGGTPLISKLPGNC